MGNDKPDLVQARKTALMAHAVVIRLKELGLPDELDDALAIVCTDLGDIWGSKEVFDGRLQSLIEGPNDWSAVGDCLVDLKVAIEHLAVHANSIKEPIERLAHYAYEAADEVAHESELMAINEIGAKLGVQPAEIQRLKDAGLLDQSNIEIEAVNPEHILGIEEGWETKRICDHLADQFVLWNSRIQSLTDENERNQAQRMLDLIGRARQKYC